MRMNVKLVSTAISTFNDAEDRCDEVGRVLNEMISMTSRLSSSISRSARTLGEVDERARRDVSVEDAILVRQIIDIQSDQVDSMICACKHAIDLLTSLSCRLSETSAELDSFVRTENE